MNSSRWDNSRHRQPMPRLFVFKYIRWLVILGLLLVGVRPFFALAQVDQPEDPADPIVSRVNDTVITRNEFHARIRLVRWQYLKELVLFYGATGGNLQLIPHDVNAIVTNLEDPVALGDAVLFKMEEEWLLWQVATQMDIDLMPRAEDVQLREARFFSAWSNIPVEQLATDPAAREFIETWYTDAQAISGLSQDDLRRLFENEELRSRVFEHFTQQVPQEELMVHTRHILCSFHPDNVSDLTLPLPEESAAAVSCIQAAQLRLAAGEAFETVAADSSHDQTSAQQGGDVGWAAMSFIVQNYAEAVREAELNTLIGPVETEFGWHLIEVLERKMQPLSTEEYVITRRDYFNQWLDLLWENASVERSTTWAENLPVEPGMASLAPDVLAAVEAISQ